MEFATDRLEHFLTNNASKQCGHGADLPCSGVCQLLKDTVVQIGLCLGLAVDRFRVLDELRSIVIVVGPWQP